MKKKFFIFLAVLMLLSLPLSVEAANRPKPNPYLSSELYGITHFDPSQSDSTPYGPPKGVWAVDSTKQDIAYGGPVNIITLASTSPKHMWLVGSNRVAYLRKADWKILASCEALHIVSSDYGVIPDGNFSDFEQSSAIGKTVDSMNAELIALFGDNYNGRMFNGIYSVVDNNDVLYSNYGDAVCSFKFEDSPAKISIVKTIPVEDFSKKGFLRIVGLSMTYDGFLVVAFYNGLAIIDRENLEIKDSLKFDYPQEYVTNSVAMDENNGIYVATTQNMYKLVWKDGVIYRSDTGDGRPTQDEAWKYTYGPGSQPPIIKVGDGTGSTPTLMGFRDDPDKLVVITDGTKRMKLLAFWRDEIPAGHTRVAGTIPVTCGLKDGVEWVQSEQSVVVEGYGAFVVNNIPETIPSDLMKTTGQKLLQVSLMGPAYPTSQGAERFRWDTVNKKWISVWRTPTVSSTSMVPIYSRSSNMAIVNGYTDADGWEVTGLDWETGEVVHRTIFGDKNFGNGAYAILQYLEDGSLLFNSIAGPSRISYETKQEKSSGCNMGDSTLGVLLLPGLFLKRKQLTAAFCINCL